MTLVVPEYDEAIRFFVDALGFALVEDTPRGGRVGFFLQVDDFAATYDRMVEHGVEFTEEPRHEEYGTVVVFRDLAGNTWDLLGAPQTPA